jgi:excisionase family DNA binding protein
VREGGVVSGRLLSPEEIAVRTGLKRRAIYRAIQRGDLRAYKLCDRLRVEEADYEAWLEASVVETPQRAEIYGPRPLPAANGLRRLLDS